MNLTISGHHLEITPALRSYVTNKLDRITRHFDQVVDVKVLMTCTRRWTSWWTSSIARSCATRTACKTTISPRVGGSSRRKCRLEAHFCAVPTGARASRPSGGFSCGFSVPMGLLTWAVHNSYRHAMNRLASILPSAQVLVSVDATSKKRAFEEAGLLFETLHGLSRALITDSLFARERLGSTGLGHGVAIPHGRIKGLKSPMAAVFQLERPIGFDAPDELPVSLLIFLLVPEAATQKHLEILSEIAELLSDAPLRERIKCSTDAAELHGLIASWQSTQAA